MLLPDGDAQEEKKERRGQEVLRRRGLLSPRLTFGMLMFPMQGKAVLPLGLKGLDLVLVMFLLLFVYQERRRKERNGQEVLRRRRLHSPSLDFGMLMFPMQKVLPLGLKG